MLLSNLNVSTDESKRALYVAMTRAKKNLYIHYNSTYLRNVEAGNLQYKLNQYKYSEPAYISFILTLHDVWLDYFDKVQSQINGIVSGTSLVITSKGLTNYRGALIVRFSKKFPEKIQQQMDKGYLPIGAKTNFVVYWNNKETGKDIKIVLPEVGF